jgi:hypothetical protein
MSHLSPSPPVMVTAAANQLSGRLLRWGYRVVAVLIHEFWLLTGLSALVIAGRKLPFPLMLIGALTLARLVFPAALYPEAGRYALIFVPFLAGCTIWFAGGAEPGLRAPCRSRYFLIMGMIVTVQCLFVLRWGWSR